MKKYHSLRLILGDQLNRSHSWYKEKDDGVLYVLATSCGLSRNEISTIERPVGQQRGHWVR